MVIVHHVHISRYTSTICGAAVDHDWAGHEVTLMSCCRICEGHVHVVLAGIVPQEVIVVGDDQRSSVRAAKERVFRVNVHSTGDSAIHEAV